MLGKKAALDLGVFRIFGRKGLTNLPILKSNFRSFFSGRFPSIILYRRSAYATKTA